MILIIKLCENNVIPFTALHFNKGEHLGPVTGFLLILIKFVCFGINVVSVLIYVCFLL